jgi:hypothetical protein
VKTIRLGCGAGYSGDRIDPAVELATSGDLDYLVFECLAERTIALAQLQKARHPDEGFDPRLERRMMAVLAACHERGVRVITNMGAANPQAAAAVVRECARRLGLSKLRVAAITGDDVLEWARRERPPVDAAIAPADFWPSVVSANAYLGAEPIVAVLAAGADVVITGRIADPSLFVAPLLHEFGWAADDWPALGRATVVGHLLECAGQVTGGYFADPGLKDVPGLARLGFPLAEVREDGSACITKVAGSGGRVTLATCKEQLLYEVHDPACYLTPDVTADFSGVSFTDAGTDRVEVRGATGRPRPERLKVSIGYRDGYVGEGQMSYAGTGAVARGRLALDILRERLQSHRDVLTEMRFDLIGVDALHGADLSRRAGDPYEVRVRVVARASRTADAERVGDEVEALYTNGPAGGGGAFKSVRDVLAIASAYVPRDAVHVRSHIEAIS